MALPKPHDGLVIRYGYLWDWQYRAGQQEGRDRPCMILRVFDKPDGQGPRARERRIKTVDRTDVGPQSPVR